MTDRAIQCAEEIEALSEKATDGPWEVDRWFPASRQDGEQNGWKVGKDFDQARPDIFFQVPYEQRGDAELIAQYRQLAPEAARHIRELTPYKLAYESLVEQAERDGLDVLSSLLATHLMLSRMGDD